jgi:hypothetical protein
MAHTHIRLLAATVDRDGAEFVLWALRDPDPRGGTIACGVTGTRPDEATREAVTS